MGAELRSLASRSLALLQAHEPWHAGRLAELLGGCPVALEVCGEAFGVGVHGGVVAVGDVPAEPCITVEASLQAVQALLRGTHTVGELVEDGQIDVFGPDGALSELAEAARVFIHGAMRCPGQAKLLLELEESLDVHH